MVTTKKGAIRFPQTLLLAVISLVFLATPQFAASDISDPLDPFDRRYDEGYEDLSDDQKTASELIDDAIILLQGERPLDARTKLLKALQKDPKAFQAHVLLASYYLVHVGHFRLALKYIKQAENLFIEIHGKPPYTTFPLRNEHARMLYLRAQIRLDLDNYQGALDTLDEFTDHGYYGTWYPGSRAWVLMKLGQLDEAIRVARLGVLADSERGRTLNMLGILLSMHGEREASLRVFQDAIEYEMALGPVGQPATPLNNSGEVYRELFSDDKAEASWVKATSLRDGCEHVLPSLNLALLYLEQINLAAASRTIDNFESCIAQFPLRNGEEHRALVHLIRGRIDLHAGDIESAIKHLEQALQKRQWFGKIGTSQEDMAAAVHFSMAQALVRRINHRDSKLYPTWRGWIQARKDSMVDYLRARWMFRRARQILAEDLKDLEDLSIRNTDSLLEYPTLGELLRTFPKPAIKRRIEKMVEKDKRKPAQPFYKLYTHEVNRVRPGSRLSDYEDQIAELRPRYDDLLRVHSLMNVLDNTPTNSRKYALIAEQVFRLNRASLRNYGQRLPVNFEINDAKLIALLDKTTFYLTSLEGAAYKIRGEVLSDGQIALEFTPKEGSRGAVRVNGVDLEETVNKFVDEVFKESVRAN